jgi:hypothetical protein
MTKKDEKEADRPHYYSQFWLDVAAGRKVIGASKAEDGADQTDADLQEPTPLARRGGRAGASIPPADGYREMRAPAAVADEAYDEEDEDEDEFPALEVDEPRGFMKAIVDADTNQILGCAILGLEGGELMAMLEIAMMGKLPYTVLREAIFAHPTLAEAYNNLFGSFEE